MCFRYHDPSFLFTPLWSFAAILYAFFHDDVRDSYKPSSHPVYSGIIFAPFRIDETIIDRIIKNKIYA